MTAPCDLEAMLTDRSAMLRFRKFLNSIYSAENLTFWLEVEIYEYLPDEEISEKAQKIYKQYFSGSPDGTPINLDDNSQELELQQKMYHPTRETFVTVKGIVWGLLKFECFPRFKSSPMFSSKLSKKDEASMKDDYTVTLLDTFLTLRKNLKKKSEQKKLAARAAAKVAAEQAAFEAGKNLDDNLYDQPDIEEIFDDRDLMLAFREYLYETHIQENLVFWFETELYRRIDDSELRSQRANEIIDKFCRSDSPYIINCDEALLNKMIKESSKPSPSTFRAAQKMTWTGLKNEWFPQFCVSKLYQEFDKQRLKIKKSNTNRERGNSLDYYDQIIALKARLQSVNRDFIAEITMDDALSPQTTPRTKANVHKVPVPVMSPTHPMSSSSSASNNNNSGSSSQQDSKKDKAKQKEKEKEKEKEKDKKEKPSTKESKGDTKATSPRSKEKSPTSPRNDQDKQSPRGGRSVSPIPSTSQQSSSTTNNPISNNNNNNQDIKKLKHSNNKSQASSESSSPQSLGNAPIVAGMFGQLSIPVISSSKKKGESVPKRPPIYDEDTSSVSHGEANSESDEDHHHHHKPSSSSPNMHHYLLNHQNNHDGDNEKEASEDSSSIQSLQNKKKTKGK